MAMTRPKGALTQTMFAVRQGVPPAPPPRWEASPLGNPPAKERDPLTPPTVRRLDTRQGFCTPAPALEGMLPPKPPAFFFGMSCNV